MTKFYDLTKALAASLFHSKQKRTVQMLRSPSLFEELLL